MIEFFIMFTFIGFIIGYIFPKGHIAYISLIVIPVLWMFKFGFFWALVSFGELILGVVIAHYIAKPYNLKDY